jgi:23S rRNA pseudouridine1911/1915/1917 synthase
VWNWKVPIENFEAFSDRADVSLLKALTENQGSSSEPLPLLITRSHLKRLIEEGRVTENLKPIKAKDKLKPGAEIQIEFPPPLPTELVPEDRPIEILYQDEHLVVINKPPGLTVHPSPTQMEGTLVHALLHHIQDLSGIGGVLRPGIVHRIDKNTSGALVITKTDAAHVRLTEVFARHKIKRAYWALCYGSPKMDDPTIPIKIESLIGRSTTDRKKMSMKVTSGRHAVSYYKKLYAYAQPNKNPFASWLEVTLETGRTHQVRVHLTGLGCSILGDPVYGTPTESQSKWTTLPSTVRAAVKELPGQALHARILGFQHPITGKELYFEAEPPPAFQNLLQCLENYK